MNSTLKAFQAKLLNFAENCCLGEILEGSFREDEVISLCWYGCFLFIFRWKGSIASFKATKISKMFCAKWLSQLNILLAQRQSEHAHHSRVCLGTSHLHEIVALTTYVCLLTRAESSRHLLPGFTLLPDMLDHIVVKAATCRVIKINSVQLFFTSPSSNNKEKQIRNISPVLVAMNLLKNCFALEG